ncbi:maleate cis-trans isomerase family protein [Paracoccus tegillarcae]|uniref:Ectoine utilization protein EutA n=1 Tax=Paracoccus tegillarcae TaxID=1529068 RepID=A0A2K9EBK2_9RHOB|nr:ectoine utilization protein EutA [Paracoccus tegillarcae]AUH32293.1 ectoine utilization protein EutA [Paracoccus tegillarcae]
MQSDLLQSDPVVRFGLIALATDMTTEGDAAMLMPAGTRLHTTRIAFDNPTTPDNLRATGPRLRDAASLLVPDVPLAGIGFACTSAGAVLGDDLPSLLGDNRAPISTPAGGAVRALRALGLDRIALMTPYLPQTAVPVADYFAQNGVALVSQNSMGFEDDRDMARLTDQAMIDAVLAADHSDAQALFMSCTALPALRVVPRLEAMLGKPVLTSNLTLFWAMLDQARLPMAGPYSLTRCRTW